MKKYNGRYKEREAYLLAKYWGLSMRAYNALQRFGLFTKRNIPKMGAIYKLIVSVKGNKKCATPVPLIGHVVKNEISQWHTSTKRKRVFLNKVKNMPKVSI